MINDIKLFIINNFCSKKAFIKAALISYNTSLMFSMLKTFATCNLDSVLNILTWNLQLDIMYFGEGNGSIFGAITLLFVFYIIQCCVAMVTPKELWLFEFENKFKYNILGLVYSLATVSYLTLLVNCFESAFNYIGKIVTTFANFFYMPTIISYIAFTHNSIAISYITATIIITIVIYIVNILICNITKLDIIKHLRFITLVIVSLFVLGAMQFIFMGDTCFPSLAI